MPLEELMGFDGEKGGLPRVVKDCIQYLRSTGSHPLERTSQDLRSFLGLQDEGLFRRSPNSVMLKQAQQAYDRGRLYESVLAVVLKNILGHVVSLETFGDPHLAAVLLKKFLRDLPMPLFPEHLYPLISRCPQPSDDPDDLSFIIYIRGTLMPELPHCSYILLASILRESPRSTIINHSL